LDINTGIRNTIRFPANAGARSLLFTVWAGAQQAADLLRLSVAPPLRDGLPHTESTC
jgi:hypothetical protein